MRRSGFIPMLEDMPKDKVKILVNPKAKEEEKDK